MRTLVVLSLLAASPALSSEPPAREEKPSAKAELQQTAVESKPEASETGEFKPPPGFRAKKRGEMTLYCRREAVLGSRFPAEKCYDEAGIRQLRLADLEKTEMLERIRTCGTGSCSAN